ncbi:hypothetical protein [Acinetobacter baumannii]|uniref:hypothetical protein n=1 Tax=Acinetobacter baumannii TaxID=470 RepID=UPI001126F4B9|nr:hypothetical protein [Acinetobacter baumannii]TPT33426.1 hypothetical protein FJU68_10540 [Acinetobacter baumannii]
MKTIFYRYYVWFLIFLYAGANYYLYDIIETQLDVLLIVFINLSTLLFTLYPFLIKIGNKIKNEDFLNFIEVPKRSIKFPDLTAFLGEQALGSLLATLTIVYGRNILEITNSGLLAGVVIYLLFISTITITTLSLSRITLQIIYLKIGWFKEFIIILIFFFITYWAYIGGLKLVPSS